MLRLSFSILNSPFSILAIGLAGFATPAHAQQTTPPELQALISQAVEHSPVVRQGMLQEQAVKLRSKDIKSGLLPSITGTAGYTYLRPVSAPVFALDPSKPVTFSFQPNNNYDAHVGLSQQLLDFGRVKTNLQAALEQEANARTTTESFKHLISYQVAQTYYGIVFLRQSIAVQDTILASLGENARTIDVKIRQGQAIDLDRLNTKSQIDQTQDRRTDLVNQLNKQMAALEYLVGNRPNVGAMGGFDFRLADTTGLASGAGNYDLKLAAGQTNLAQRNQEVTTKVFYPSLVANVTGGVKNGYLLKDHTINDPLPNFAAGATLSVPLYTGGRNQRAQQIAATQTAIAKAQQDEARDAYRRDLTQALSDRDGATQKLRNARGQVDQAARALQLSQSRYRNGVAINLDVLKSNDLYQQARLMEVNARYQLILAELEIARLAGVQLK